MGYFAQSSHYHKSLPHYLFVLEIITWANLVNAISCPKKTLSYILWFLVLMEKFLEINIVPFFQLKYIFGVVIRAISM